MIPWPTERSPAPPLPRSRRPAAASPFAAFAEGSWFRHCGGHGDLGSGWRNHCYSWQGKCRRGGSSRRMIARERLPSRPGSCGRTRGPPTQSRLRSFRNFVQHRSNPGGMSSHLLVHLPHTAAAILLLGCDRPPPAVIRFHSGGIVPVRRPQQGHRRPLRRTSNV